MVVLDEADEMLDMGFADDLDAILDALPDQTQTVLFSATMPPRIEKMARKHLTNPITITIKATKAPEGEAPLVRQTAYVVPRSHKAAALGRILDVEAPTAAIVFCRTRNEVDQLTETLNGRGYRAEALHGGLNQEGRDRVMGRVRNGSSDLLVATDVAARGLDIDLLSHVVNYDVPSAPEAYVHRIGRVGRAGREGVAITLAEPREHRLLENIQRVTGQQIEVEKVPTITDLRNRRMELTLSLVREALLGDEGELDRYRTIVETLTDEADPFEVALAAVKLVHEAANPADADEEEIPDAKLRPRRDDRDSGDRGGYERGPRGGDRGSKGAPRKGGNRGGDVVRLFFPVGRAARIGPGDLVGAITGETSPAGPRHRRHRDHREVLAGRGARRLGRRGHRRHEGRHDPRPPGERAPRALRPSLKPRDGAGPLVLPCMDMDLPVLVAVDDDADALAAVEGELLDRYARHYRVAGLTSVGRGGGPPRRARGRRSRRGPRARRPVAARDDRQRTARPRRPLPPPRPSGAADRLGPVGPEPHGRGHLRRRRPRLVRPLRRAAHRTAGRVLPRVDLQPAARLGRGPPGGALHGPRRG